MIIQKLKTRNERSHPDSTCVERIRSHAKLSSFDGRTDRSIPAKRVRFTAWRSTRQTASYKVCSIHKTLLKPTKNRTRQNIVKRKSPPPLVVTSLRQFAPIHRTTTYQPANQRLMFRSDILFFERIQNIIVPLNLFNRRCLK